MLKPIPGHRDGRDKPKQRIRQIDPNGILHARDARVPLGVLFDVHATEQTEERDPEDEKYAVPDEEEGDFEGEGDHV